MWSSSREVAESFNHRGDEGKQVLQYFNFMKVVLINNLFMTAWSLIGWIPHAINVWPRLRDEGVSDVLSLGRAGVAEILFLSTFQPSSDAFWDAMMGLGVATMMITPIIYFVVAKRFFDDEQKDEDSDPSTVDEDDRTEFYEHWNGKSRIHLMIMSYALFMIVCAIPAAVDYGLVFDLTHRKLKPLYEKLAGIYPSLLAKTTDASDDLSPTEITMIVVLIKAVMDVVFETVAAFLTSIERHVSYSSFRYHRLFKLVIFRFCNTMSLFIIRYYADVPFYPCLASRVSNQLTLNNLVEIGTSAILKLYAKFADQQRAKSLALNAIPLTSDSPRPLSAAIANNDSHTGRLAGTDSITGLPISSNAAPLNKAVSISEPESADRSTSNVDGASEIELTDDYLEIVYRQYIMMAFIGVFPLVTGFTLLCNLVEYPLDKIKFIKFSNRSIRGNFQNSTALLGAMLFFTGLAGVLHFPTGYIWYFPPIGPRLCWPCNTFARTETSSGVCLPGFEPAGCRDAAGFPLDQSEIRSRLAIMWSIRGLASAEQRAAAEATKAAAWLQLNDHLFYSRRCLCQPCHLVLSCPCDQAPEQRFPSLNASGQISPYAMRAYVSLLEPISAPNLPPRCNYSLKIWRQAVASARGQDPMGKAPTTRSLCGDPIAPECWTCPESSRQDFADPLRSLLRWRSLSFCDRCLSSPCICGRSDVGCPLDYISLWQIQT